MFMTTLIGMIAVDVMVQVTYQIIAVIVREEKSHVLTVEETEYYRISTISYI